MKYLTSLVLYATHVFAASQLALFTDEHCQNSLRGLEGPNGYPNGTCTDLRRTGPYGSFQVVGLDPGCTGELKPLIVNRETRVLIQRQFSHHLPKGYHREHLFRLPRSDPANRLLQLFLRILQYRLL